MPTSSQRQAGIRAAGLRLEECSLGFRAVSKGMGDSLPSPPWGLETGVVRSTNSCSCAHKVEL